MRIVNVQEVVSPPPSKDEYIAMFPEDKMAGARYDLLMADGMLPGGEKVVYYTVEVLV